MLLNRELIEQLYSSSEHKRRSAVYRILFDRRHDLINELKKAATYEKTEEIAVFMAQVCLILENFKRDYPTEKRILEYLQRDPASLSKDMWRYLERCGSSQMILGALSSIGCTISPNAYSFIESCLKHLDPEIRAAACKIAIKSGRPTHFAYILSLITDKDPVVSKTAFSVIKNIQSKEMSFILEYALGSTDEWVLKSIAPFLPLIAEASIRKTLSKFQFHPNPLVAQKIREALKRIDDDAAISMQQKSIRFEQINSEKPNKQETEKQPEIKANAVSMQELHEFKQQQEFEEQAQKKAADEALQRELETVAEDEIISFENEIKKLDNLNTAPNTDDFFEIAPEQFNNSLELQSEILASVNTNGVDLGISNTPQKAEQTPKEPTPAVQTPANKQTPLQPDKKITLPQQTLKTATNADLTTKTNLIAQANIAPQKEITPAPALQAEPRATPKPQEYNQAPKQPQTQQLWQQQPETQQQGQPKSSKKAAPPAAKKTCGSALKISLPAEARLIAENYPSFITDLYLRLFMPIPEQERLKTLSALLDNVTAFLSLAYIQACLRFASPSEVLIQSVINCLNCDLTGLQAIRCLNNFVVALKQTTGGKGFFTHPLAEALSVKSEKNPLSLMRELKAFFGDRPQTQKENLPFAIRGMTCILNGLKLITSSKIIMKTPKGAKEPFANLSGPKPAPLSNENRPVFNMPHSEIIILSSNKTEGLQLYPYFKYANKKIVFAKPSNQEKIAFVNRLKIPLHLLTGLQSAPKPPLNNEPKPNKLTAQANAQKPALNRPKPAKPLLKKPLPPTELSNAAVQNKEAAKHPIPPKQTQINNKEADILPINEAKQASTAINTDVSPQVKELGNNLPFFISQPLFNIFSTKDDAKKLQAIKQLSEALTAFLNLTYLQSCLFYTNVSDTLKQTILECLKGDLTAPNALKCLNTFVLSLKYAQGCEGFFTHSLINTLSERSETSPLMLLRELSEYLKNPIEPISETAPQAAEGVLTILSALKSISENTIAIKQSEGANERFISLNGFEPSEIPPEKKPSLDLPDNEIILLSKDQTEALGLFPYFKYNGSGAVFAAPSSSEKSILLKQLEIPAEDVDKAC